MTQQRSDIQLADLFEAAERRKASSGTMVVAVGRRRAIELSGDEIICTADEIAGTTSDLRSLRAAARRVLEAFECAFGSDGAGPLERMQFGNQILELRAEMAGIDGNNDSSKDKP